MKNTPIEDINSTSFSDLYQNYFPKLIRFAREYVVSEEDAENIVQDTFLFLWENQERFQSVRNLNAFLYTLIKNRCIDFLRVKVSEAKRNEKVQDRFEREFQLKLDSLSYIDVDHLSEEDVEKLIDEALNSLPEKCRQIFMLSRIDGLKYKEIAERLGVSVNTIENQISIALRKLRVRLKIYMPLVVYFLWTYFK